MHVDQNGLPIQENGDAKDQLQRVGMILTGYAIAGIKGFTDAATEEAMNKGIQKILQPKSGIYIRSAGDVSNNVSADQLVSTLASHVIKGETIQIFAMFFRMLYRLGFAQNYRDGLGTNKLQIPDFMLLRSFPLFLRSSKLFYPIAIVTDLYLVLAAIISVLDRDPTHVDDNLIILTLAVCRKKMLTPFSFLAIKIYSKFRAPNLGSTAMIYDPKVSPLLTQVNFHPVYGALRWYHRAEAGGNPEVAELWRPICSNIFE